MFRDCCHKVYKNLTKTLRCQGSGVKHLARKDILKVKICNLIDAEFPMSQNVQSQTLEQVTAWLRGLLTVAWADGHFSPDEQALIEQMVQDNDALANLQPILPAQLARALEPSPQDAENFLRTAVMVAIADGVYSTAEDQLLQQYCAALGINPAVLEQLRLTLDGQDLRMQTPEVETSGSTSAAVNPLQPVRRWLDQMEVHSSPVAHFLCKMIPPQCPFERDITLFRHKVVHIPPLCKLNPLYEQLVQLRFRALSYLADECGEDISAYC